MTLDKEFITRKWKPVLENELFDPITDSYKEKVTAILLENQTNYIREAIKTENDFNGTSLLMESPTNSAGTGGFSGSAAAGGPVAGYDPVLISLIRRSTPQLMAFDVCGVQPMSGPTGLIFAMRSIAGADRLNDPETFYNEVDTGFSAGESPQVGTNPGLLNIRGAEPADGGTTPGTSTIYNARDGYPTGTAEDLGDGTAFREMGISIEKHQVTAQTRALKAEYSLELAQDMKAIHGLEAEAELSSILSTEIMAEINREVIRTIYGIAKPGAQTDVTTAGIFDLDADSTGRWSVEKFKGLLFQIEKECNAIGQQTRRGKGNFIICNADVASALAMVGVLDYSSNPRFQGSNIPDDTQSTFAGTLNGRIKVFVDPYAANVSGDQYFVAGYKGTSAYDAGLFYCPYIPLQKVRAVDPATFQPKIGFKTRYGMTANPFAEGLTKGQGALRLNSNVYYRRVRVRGVSG